MEWSDGAIKVWVHVPPVGGQANIAACELIAKALGVAVSAVEVARGETSRQKLISVSGLSLDEIREKLSRV